MLSRLLGPLLFGLTLGPALAQPHDSSPEVKMKDCSAGPVRCWKIYAPQRVLRFELALPVATERVWAAWTDPRELTTWAGPGAAVDLEEGGTWEVHFFPDRPPGERGGDANRILALDAGREILFAAGAPLEFPTVRQEKTKFRVRLRSIGEGHTLVSIEQTGWKSGDEWERAFEAMAAANTEWLGWLHRRFVSGPIDWNAMEISEN